MATEGELIALGLDTRPAQAGADAFEQSIEKVIAALTGVDSRLDTVEASTRTFAQSSQTLVAALTNVHQKLASADVSTRAFARSNAIVGDSLIQLADAERRQAAATAGMQRQMQVLTETMTHLSVAMRQSQRGARATAADMESIGRAAQRANPELARFQTRMLAMVSIFGGGFALRAGIRALSEFEESMVRVGAVSGATQSQFAELRAEAIRLGEQTVFSTTEAAQAQLLLAQAGFSTQEILDAGRGVLDFAVAGNLELAEAADVASSALRQFGLPAGQVTRVTDTMVTAAFNANTNVRQMAEAMNYAAPIAAAFGLDIEEVGAAIGVLGDAGIKASLAGTNLRGVLAALSDPTQEARRELREAGVDLSKLDTTANDFVSVARELDRAFENGANAFTIFGRRNAAAATILGDFADKMQVVIDKERESEDAAGGMTKALAPTLSKAIDELTSALDSAVQSSGDAGLLGALKGLTRFTTDVVRKIADLNLETDRFGIASDIAAVAVQTLIARLAVGAVLRWSAAIAGGIRQMVQFTAATRTATGAAAGLSRVAIMTNWATLIGAVSFALWEFVRAGDAAKEKASELSDEAVKALTLSGRLRGDLASFAEAQGQQSGQRALLQANRNVQALEAARASLAGIGQTGGTPVVRFESVEGFTQEVRRLAAAATSAEDRLRRLREAAANPTARAIEHWVQLRENLARAEIDATKASAAFDSLIQSAVRAGDSTFIRRAFVAPLEEALGLTEELDKAEAAAQERIGLPSFVDVLDVEALLAQLAKERQDVAREIAQGVVATERENFEALVESLREPLEAEAQLLRERADLLAQAERGEITLAEAIARGQRATELAKLEQQARSAGQREGIELTDDEVAAIVELGAANLDAADAVDELADRLRERQKAIEDAQADAADFVAGLEDQIEAMRLARDETSLEAKLLGELGKILPATAAGYADVAGRVRELAAALEAANEAKELDKARDSAQSFVDQLRRQVQTLEVAQGTLSLEAKLLGELAEILPPTAEGFDELAAKVREYAAALEEAEQSKGRGSRGDPYTREQRQIDAQREILSGLEAQARALGLTRLETEKLAVAEQLRLQNASRAQIDEALGLVDLIDKRRQLRDVTDATAESGAAALKALIRDGASASEALYVAFDTLSTRILDQSLERLQDEFSAGLFQLFSPDEPSDPAAAAQGAGLVDAAKGAAEDGVVASAVQTSGATVVQAVQSGSASIVAAIQAQPSAEVAASVEAPAVSVAAAQPPAVSVDVAPPAPDTAAAAGIELAVTAAGASTVTALQNGVAAIVAAIQGQPTADVAAAAQAPVTQVTTAVEAPEVSVAAAQAPDVSVEVAAPAVDLSATGIETAVTAAGASMVAALQNGVASIVAALQGASEPVPVVQETRDRIVEIQSATRPAEVVRVAPEPSVPVLTAPGDLSASVTEPERPALGDASGVAAAVQAAGSGTVSALNAGVTSIVAAIEALSASLGAAATAPELQAAPEDLVSPGAAAVDTGIVPPDLGSTASLETAIGASGASITTAIGTSTASIVAAIQGASLQQTVQDTVSTAQTVAAEQADDPIHAQNLAANQQAAAAAAGGAGGGFGWGNLGMTALQGVIGLGLGLLTSRLSQRDEPRGPPQEFDPVSPRRGGSVVVHDNSRITVQSGGPEAHRVGRAVRQAREDQIKRWR